MNSLSKTVTRQRHSCDLKPGPSVPESTTLTTRLPSHLCKHWQVIIITPIIQDARASDEEMLTGQLQLDIAEFIAGVCIHGDQLVLLLPKLRLTSLQRRQFQLTVSQLR